MHFWNNFRLVFKISFQRVLSDYPWKFLKQKVNIVKEEKNEDIKTKAKPIKLIN